MKPALRTDLLKSLATKGALDTFVWKVPFGRVCRATVGALRALLQDSVHVTRSRRRRQPDDTTKLAWWRRSRGSQLHALNRRRGAIPRAPQRIWRFCSISAVVLRLDCSASLGLLRGLAAKATALQTSSIPVPSVGSSFAAVSSTCSTSPACTWLICNPHREKICPNAATAARARGS